MKTVEEINAISPFKSNEWQQGYGIWESGFIEGERIGAEEQKAIDNSQLPNRYEKALNKQKQILIDKACEWLKARCVLRDVSIERFRQEMEE